MIVLIRFYVIVSNIIGTFCISEGYFTRLNGYKVSGGFSIFNFDSSSVRIKCAKRCFQTPCKSFNYNSQTNECQLNTDSPYTNTGAVEEADGWAIYHLQRENDWELVFRAQAGNSLSPYKAWMGTLSLPTPVEDGCRLMTGTFPCSSIYRSDVLNRWESESITEVQVELYQGGNRVVYVRLNGTGSTVTNWFDKDNLVDSGWSTMSTIRTFNFFSMSGSDIRTFFINQNYGGCHVDRGWMAVVDADVDSSSCVWDNIAYSPALLFAPGDDVAQWQNFEYEEADVLAMFIKR